MPKASIHERLREVAQQDRRCEVCAVNVTLGGLCLRHRDERLRHGTTTPHKRLLRKEWDYGIGSPLRQAEAYIAAHPLTSDVREGLHNVLSPGNPLPVAKSGRQNPAALLRRELLWHADPQSAKKWYGPAGTAPRPYTYSDEERIAVLLAVTLYIDAREGVGFPHDSPDIERACALLSMRSRPHRATRRRNGRVQNKEIVGTVRHAVGRRIRQAPGLGLYLLAGARTILRDQGPVRFTPSRRRRRRARHPQITQLPPRYPRPLYRCIEDREAIQKWEHLEPLWEAADRNEKEGKQPS
jgi:hypothetical protein